MSKEKKEYMTVEVNGDVQEREVAYKIWREDGLVAYPVMSAYEHLYENCEGLMRVFASEVR